MMPCYIVVHAYYDAVLHSCRLVVLQLYAMVDRDSFQTAKTHFTRYGEVRSLLPYSVVIFQRPSALPL